MPDVNLLAVLGSAIVVFVIGFTYYAGFGMHCGRAEEVFLGVG